MAAETTYVRPFRVDFSQEALDDLHRRIVATRWPEKETVADASKGVQIATMQALARYWAEKCDYRRVEARLNALPQFITEIDGLDIHFIHVRSKHEDALPLIATHGWPGSVIEFLKVVGPLTDPEAHDGSAEDAFHLVIPSIPGYGCSGKPTDTGWVRLHRTRLGHADAASWLHGVRRAGRRLGGGHQRCDGHRGTSGTARHPLIGSARAGLSSQR